jgi:hypothetical protein
MITQMVPGGLFSEGAFDRLFQVVNGAMDRLFHSAFLMRHDDGLAAVAAHLDHAAFVIMASLMTDGIAKVHIDPPYTVSVAVQCGMDYRLHLSGRLLAAFDVGVCPDLDQHFHLRRYNVYKLVTLFDAATLEEALVRCVLSYIRGLALLRLINVSMPERLAWRNFGSGRPALFDCGSPAAPVACAHAWTLKSH